MRIMVQLVLKVKRTAARKQNRKELSLIPKTEIYNKITKQGLDPTA